MLACNALDLGKSISPSNRWLFFALILLRLLLLAGGLLTPEWLEEELSVSLSIYVVVVPSTEVSFGSALEAVCSMGPSSQRH